jgi:hypothetical protein
LGYVASRDLHRRVSFAVIEEPRNSWWIMRWVNGGTRGRERKRRLALMKENLRH